MNRRELLTKGLALAGLGVAAKSTAATTAPAIVMGLDPAFGPDVASVTIWHCTLIDGKPVMTSISKEEYDASVNKFLPKFPRVWVTPTKP